MAPHNDPFFYVTAVATVTGSPTLYDLTTNIPVGDPAFYGYNFMRWTMRRVLRRRHHRRRESSTRRSRSWSTTLEVLIDTGGATSMRVFRVNINPTDQTPTLSESDGQLPRNPTGYTTQLPGQYLVAAPAARPGHRPFILDGRWLHAFNGPGMTTNAVHGNFRYNGLEPATPWHGRGLRRRRPGELVPGHAERRWAGDHPLVPSPRGHPVRPQRCGGDRRSTTGPHRAGTAATDLGRLGFAHPPPSPVRRPRPEHLPRSGSRRPTAGSPTTWTTTATA